VDDVIKRSEEIGCDRLLFSAGNLQDSKVSFELSKKSPKFFCTVGVHPCRVKEIEAYPSQEKYIEELENEIKIYKEKCVAIGECGLDYDRFEYAEKEYQLKHFPFHFDLAQKYKLPMYLHNRNTGDDFFNIVKENRHKFSTGVVHSFTGNADELKKIVDLNLYIGINGCSLKTPENIEVLKQVPIDKMMLETDSPYCEIRNSHAGSSLVKTKFQSKAKEKFQKGLLIKGRNEPCNIIQVAEVVSSVLKMDIKEFSEIVYQNSLKFFNIKEESNESTEKQS
jgi:TatD DNase family protein